MKLETPESVTHLVEWLRAYANERLNSATMDERRCLPPSLVLDFGNRGLLGMLAEKSYGGLGLGHAEVATVLEQLGAIDATVCLFVGLNNYLGIRPIATHASRELQDELLPRLATGRELAAFALTEPGAGSNPRAMESRAENVGPDHWRLYGTKYWIGSAQWAGVLNVFAREGATHAVGGHVVRQGTKGLRMGCEAPTMGMRAMVQNTVFLEGVPTSRRDRLGQEGQGMLVAQDTMTHGRLAIGALCLGAMQRCAQLALRYATRRQVSTGLLLANPATLAKLSRMTAAATALRYLVHRLAAAADSGKAVPIEGFTACKVAAPEFLWRSVDDLMQLVGGRGYMESTPIPQMMRDARVLRIFEGPTETMEAFLGARLMGNSPSLAQLLSETLTAPRLVQRLDELAPVVAERSAHLQKLYGTGSIHWGQVRAGRLATWLILQAAIEGSEPSALPEEARRAATWASSHLDQELRLLQHDIPEDVVCLGATALGELIDGFSQRVGDVAQSLPLMDNTLDPLLRREQHPRATPAAPAEPDI